MSRRKLKKVCEFRADGNENKRTLILSDEGFSGASDEARTRYLHLGKVALYQMSYTRINKWYYSMR